ncbi:Uncharacterized protein QTN25_001449 [Entamoeba marina]
MNLQPTTTSSSGSSSHSSSPTHQLSLEERIQSYATKIENDYTNFEKQFDDALNALKNQIYSTEESLKEVVNRCTEHELPSIIPDSVYEMLDVQLKAYYDECDEVIGQQTKKLSRYDIIQPEEIEFIQPPKLSVVDDGKSFQLFDEAINQTNELCRLLGADVSSIQSQHD